MKNLFLQIIFVTLIGLSFYNFIFAQEKPIASKFDEFDDSTNEYLYTEPISISQRIERFAKQIKKQPNSKVYIVYYQSRITDSSYNQGQSLANTIESILTNYKGINYENITLIDGGVREKRTIEFWLAPKKAEPPTPTPQFDKTELILCPAISVYGNGFSYIQNKTVNFSVSINNIAETPHLEYEWKVSAGSIITGQGTKEISVDTSKSDVKNIMAFVKVKGVDFLCKDSSWTTLEINNNNAIQIAQAVHYNESTLKAQLDAVFIELNNNPTAKGYIIIYAKRNEGAKEMERAIRSIKMSIRFRRFDSSRIEIVKGGYRDENTVDMWILPTGAIPPRLTPTVDKKFIEIPVKKKTK